MGVGIKSGKFHPTAGRKLKRKLPRESTRRGMRHVGSDILTLSVFYSVVFIVCSLFTKHCSNCRGHKKDKKRDRLVGEKKGTSQLVSLL